MTKIFGASARWALAQTLHKVDHKVRAYLSVCNYCEDFTTVVRRDAFDQRDVLPLRRFDHLHLRMQKTMLLLEGHAVEGVGQPDEGSLGIRRDDEPEFGGRNPLPDLAVGEIDQHECELAKRRYVLVLRQAARPRV